MPGARDDCEKTRLRADDSLGKLSGARKLLAYLSRDWVRCFVLMLIGFIIHLPALPGGLIWDDEYLARDNPFIKSPLLLLETFRHYLFPDAFSTHYRPVQTISYLFDYAFWNNNSYGFHLSNVLWHLGSGVLLYFLLKRLLAPLRAALDSEGSRSQSGMIAFFVALLWVVHPVQSAAVDYISGRADSLAFFFACAAWLLFLRGARILHSLGRVACYSLSAFFLLLALCSRESALIWVALFLFHLFALEKRFGQRAKLCVLIACFGIVTLYAGLRHLPRDARTTIPASTTLASTRAVLMLRALGDYGRLMIFPANLHMERTVESDDAASVSVGLATLYRHRISFRRRPGRSRGSRFRKRAQRSGPSHSHSRRGLVHHCLFADLKLDRAERNRRGALALFAERWLPAFSGGLLFGFS